MPQLNIAFDGKSPDELLEFVKTNTESFGTGKVHIKINDMLAEIGLEGLKNLENEIRNSLGINITWMIDGKWNDIPNTVANYARRLEGLSIAYYTVHASGGGEMIKAAKKAAPEKKLLAITVLTSMSENETHDIYKENRANSILRLASVALEAGADGLVCSPSDASMLREVFSEKYGNFLLVTPNIARTGVNRNDDQNTSLTTTPRQAIENGSSDIVVGRPILTAESPGEVITEMLREMSEVQPKTHGNGDFGFEKILHTGDWESVLKYIGAIYRKSEGGKFVRLTSGFLSDTYINIGASERDYRVLERASDELALTMKTRGIEANHILGAQMGSVRLSAFLAKSLSIGESTYTEKNGDSMVLGRHDIGENGFAGKKVVLSEDVITKGSTLAKMMEIVQNGGGEVVAISCVVNRSGKDNYEGIPLFYLYTPPNFGMWWDEKTLEKTRSNELAAGKKEEEIGVILNRIRETGIPLPESTKIAEKPKNEWNELIKSMYN